MKTLTRYVMAAAGVVTFLVALKVLIMVPPDVSPDKYSERHNKDKSVLRWGGQDRHEELNSFVKNDPRLTGEMGRGVVLPASEKAQGEAAVKKYNVNVLASDLISLNRRVPDSRPVGCESVQYPDNLPGTAVVIIFHNEWPSVLLRTVYSLINRTPKQLLEQIILVDDASDLKSLKDDLNHFIAEHFPSNLVKLVRLPERVGLIRARLEGFRHVTSEVVSFFDSHMEVNVDWLQPLLVEIVKDRRTIAMGHLDYILPDTFEYSFTPGYRTRYGFDWRLIFFETYFLKSQEKDKDVTDPLPGVVMVGPGFAITSEYFREMGTYDEGMKIWGGENLELAWRVWMCGGRLVHMACSKMGHIARPQPYSFPEGRYETEIHNYKRAIEVWMGPYKQIVYKHHPKMKDLDVGDLTERIALKNRLQCKDFTWYLKNVWPELYPYGDNATHWGGVKNQKEGLCLDNNEYLFIGPEPLLAKDCNYEPNKQSFALTIDHKLRAALQCVGVQEEAADMVPVLITCHDEPYHTWTYTPAFQLKHDQTGLCLELMKGPRLVMQSCRGRLESQIWRFEQTGKPTSLANAGVEVVGIPAAAAAASIAGAKRETEVTRTPKEMIDAFEHQLFQSKQRQINDAMAAQGMPGNMPGGPPMMQGGPPRMQGGPPMMQGGPPMMQGGPPMMQGGPPMMQGGPPMMQGGPPMVAGGSPRIQGVPPMMPRGGPGGNMMQGGPPMMPVGGGGGGGGVNRMQMAGGPPIIPGGGGSPMIPGGGGGVNRMQMAGGPPIMPGGGGSPVIPGGGGGVNRMQMAGGGGGPPMQQRGGGPMLPGGVAPGGGAMPRGGAMPNARSQQMMMPAGGSNRAVPAAFRNQPGGMGAGGNPAGIDLEEMQNRKLYAEAKRAGRAR